MESFLSVMETDAYFVFSTPRKRALIRIGCGIATRRCDGDRHDGNEQYRDEG